MFTISAVLELRIYYVQIGDLLSININRRKSCWGYNHINERTIFDICLKYVGDCHRIVHVCENNILYCYGCQIC